MSEERKGYYYSDTFVKTGTAASENILLSSGINFFFKEGGDFCCVFAGSRFDTATNERELGFF